MPAGAVVVPSWADISKPREPEPVKPSYPGVSAAHRREVFTPRQEPKAAAAGSFGASLVILLQTSFSMSVVPLIPRRAVIKPRTFSFRAGETKENS